MIAYLTLVGLLWLLMSSFAVLPLVEYVITIQRCEDLEDSRFSEGTKNKICVDLVQYGKYYRFLTSYAQGR